MRHRSARGGDHGSGLRSGLLLRGRLHSLSGDGENEGLQGFLARVLARAIELALCFVYDRHVLTLCADAGWITVVVCNRLATGDDDGAVTGLRKRLAGIGIEFGLLAVVGPTVIGQRMPRTVMRCLHDVVLKYIGFGLVALPLAVPDEHLSIATSKELCAIRRLSISG